MFKNEDWIAVVPWWATWPFELLRMCVRLPYSIFSLNSFMPGNLKVLPHHRHVPSFSPPSNEVDGKSKQQDEGQNACGLPSNQCPQLPLLLFGQAGFNLS